MSSSLASRSKRPADIDTSKKFIKSALVTSSADSPPTANAISSASAGQSSVVGEPLETPITDIDNDEDDSSLSSPESSPVRGTKASKVNKGPFEVSTKHADTPKVKSEATKATAKGTRKRVMTALESPSEKRAKVNEFDFERGSDGQIMLPYQSIKSIHMPPRTSTGPPREHDRPYGDTENHQNSMIIYWLDEQDKSYSAAKQLFAEKFPEHKAVEEAIRRRHIRALQRLAKKYGVKQLHEIDGVGKNTLRRGKKRTSRGYSVGTEPSPKVANSSVKFGQDAAASSPAAPNFSHMPHAPKYVRDSYKAIEKAAIVVWRDLDGLDYKNIRKRLEEDYDWSLGNKTVEKYYHLTRPKVYGAVSGMADLTVAENAEAQVEQGAEVDEEMNEDEDETMDEEA
jgi:hypothetical protein